MAISFSNALQGYKVFWSVLTENKKALQYFHHWIVKYQSLDTEDFLFLLSPSSHRFWGWNSFLVTMPNWGSFPDFCHWRGRSGVLVQLKLADFLSILLFMKILQVLELPKTSYLNWRKTRSSPDNNQECREMKMLWAFSFSVLNFWESNRF